jgi:hypothetical protein
MSTSRRSVAFAAAALIAASTFAQSDPNGLFEETMFRSGKINVVVAVVSVILLGLATWLFMMDRRVKKMEERMRSEGQKIR